MARKNKKSLNSEGKTELAKTIAEKSKSFVKTYVSVESHLAKFFKWLSGWMDRILFNQRYGKVVALLFAFLVYLLFNTGQNLLTDFKYSREIGEYAVTPIVSSQAYEVSGLVENVNVTLVGDLNEIKNAKLQNTLKITVNLTDLSEGTHSVKLEVEGAPSRVKVLLEPSTAEVSIKRKTIKRFTLGYDFANRSQMDSIYDLSEPEFEQGEVYVRASSETLNKIAYVKALIKVTKDDVKDFERMVDIYAYDENGDKIDVDIIPGQMKAKVKVSRPNKVVPITIVPTGSVPNGKAIESFTLDYTETTIYAKQEILDEINEISISIPASTLNADKEFSMPIILPNGVSKTDVNVVKIKVKLADESEKVVSGVGLSFTNNKNNLKYTIASPKDATMDVTLLGAQSILDAIEISSLTVEVDVGKIDKVGTYEVPIKAVGKNRLIKYNLKSDSVQIVCSKG